MRVERTCHGIKSVGCKTVFSPGKLTTFILEDSGDTAISKQVVMTIGLKAHAGHTAKTTSHT
jgi:hypothetical protein